LAAEVHPDEIMADVDLVRRLIDVQVLADIRRS
jgi:hypothetical protein